MLAILSFSDRERASPPSTEISVLPLVEKKYKEAFRGIYFKEQARTLKIKCRPRGRPGLVLKTKTRKTWVQESVKGSGNSDFLQKDQLCYLKRAEKLTFCIYFS